MLKDICRRLPVTVNGLLAGRLQEPLPVWDKVENCPALFLVGDHEADVDKD